MFDVIFPNDFGGLLTNVSTWVKKAVSRRLKTKKLLLVSAVCPDYAREERGFTYVTISGNIPYIARKQLEIVARITPILRSYEIELEYHITLADTEFDLPFVVEHMTKGDPFRFLQLCQNSCETICHEAKTLGIPIKSSLRFTQAFPKWHAIYHDCLKVIEKEVESDGSVMMDLLNNTVGRAPLYQAMTSQRVTQEYCRQMAIRQWAQYMTWGKLAEPTFGKGLVMMNHATPNLGRVNHPFSRQGQERIPLLKLSLSTMPVGCD